MKYIKKILIVNRGEIVCCVIKIVKKLGVCIVVVYSEGDRYVKYVIMVDEVVFIGFVFVLVSYLDGLKILVIVLVIGVDVFIFCGFFIYEFMFLFLVVYLC